MSARCHCQLTVVNGDEDITTVMVFVPMVVAWGRITHRHEQSSGGKHASMGAPHIVGSPACGRNHCVHVHFIKDVVSWHIAARVHL